MLACVVTRTIRGLHKSEHGHLPEGYASGQSFPKMPVGTHLAPCFRLVGASPAAIAILQGPQDG